MMRAPALFLDARMRGDREVHIELAGHSLRIASSSDDVIAEWPLNRLEVIERGDNSDRFVVGHIGNDISRLTLFDPVFKQALVKASPTLKASLKEGRLRRFFVWMGLVPRDT